MTRNPKTTEDRPNGRRGKPPDARPPLAPRQAVLLEMIAAYIAEHGYPPSFHEMRAALGIVSPNGITNHLRLLAAKGYIRRNPRIARGIVVVAEPGKTKI